jgi:hypothetical protein
MDEMIVLKVDMLVKPGTEANCKEYLRLLEQHSAQRARLCAV